jgi:hypothetical protein
LRPTENIGVGSLFDNWHLERYTLVITDLVFNVIADVI